MRILPHVNPRALVAKVGKHWAFFRRTRVLRRKEVLVVLTLAALTVMTEAGGLAMLLPILSFVEQGRDVVQFADSSRIAGFVVETYRWVGVPVSLLSLSATAMIFVLLRQAVNYFNAIESERLKWSIGRRLSVLFFNALLGSDAANIRKYKAGEFKVTSDYECQASAAIVRVYAAIWMHSLSFIVYTTVLFLAAPLASLLGIFIIGSIMACLGFLIRATRRLSNSAIEIRRTQIDFLNERFRAWKLIKLGGSLPIESEGADAVAGRLVENRVHLAKVSGLVALSMAPIMTLLLLSTLYIFVEVLALSVSMVMLFVLVLVRLIPVSQAFQKQITLLARYDPSIDLIDEALRRGQSHREILDTGRHIEKIERSIRFENVSFRYPERDRPALNGVSVTIPAHRMTAVMGASGAGKSTLIDLIPRIIDPDSGRILIDDIPVNEIALGPLRKQIAFVPQEPFLFDATISENIRYLQPEASDDDIREAARLANVADFIEQLPKGYETGLGDQGAKLSGGQKQRIVLARAFLSRASILILDEPTSALDYESEAAIQRAIEELTNRGKLTVIVIAHRLSTIRNADFIIQLQDGEVLRTGTASEILGQNPEVELALGSQKNQAVGQ